MKNKNEECDEQKIVFDFHLFLIIIGIFRWFIYLMKNGEYKLKKNEPFFCLRKTTRRNIFEE